MGFLDRLKSKKEKRQSVIASDSKPAASSAGAAGTSSTKPAATESKGATTETKAATATQKVKGTGKAAGWLKEYEVRRTIYKLNKELPISEDKVTEIVKKVVADTPSAFNSQPVRAVILFGAKHEELWGRIAHDALKAVVPEEAWETTAGKITGFKAGYGTVLFFEDQDSITGMQEAFPAYADNFPIWAAHSTGAASINTWAALALENVGGNLQHYHPLIDEQVYATFKANPKWKLTGQLVFGGIVEPAGPKDTKSDTVIVG